MQNDIISTEINKVSEMCVLLPRVRVGNILDGHTHTVILYLGLTIAVVEWLKVN